MPRISRSEQNGSQARCTSLARPEPLANASGGCPGLHPPDPGDSINGEDGWEVRRPIIMRASRVTSEMHQADREI
jgi:hypothetical protein